MSTKSFLDKVFEIGDADARVRRANDLLQFEFFEEGDPLPVGRKVGDPKTIPLGTKLKVGEVQVATSGVVFVLARAGNPPEAVFGWTSSRNLIGKFIGETLGEVPPKGKSKTGPNAAWEKGKFIGHKTLVNIVDNKFQIERITLDSLPAYLRLVEAAVKDEVQVRLRSGFRTFTEQEFLFNGFKKKLPGFATAAKPGFSNHQHGQAFDLDVGGFDGDPTYDWLKVNAPKLGFVRTVNKEPWHWELRPELAAQLAAKGKHKVPGVKV